MASESAIKAAIEARVTRYYSTWTIGITDNPNRCREEHGNPNYWYHWAIDLPQTAQNVETYFLAKGMKGASGGYRSADYVFIFLAYINDRIK